MRYNIRIIITIIATACLYMLPSGVYAIDETEGLSADQIIDQSNGLYNPVADTRFPATPQAARQLAQSTTDTSSTSTTQHLSSGESTSPQDSRSSAGALAAGTDTTAAATETPAPAASAPEAAPASSPDLSGKWSIKLSDAQADLTLYQNQGAVIGVGTAREGNDTRHITASGSLSGDKASLDLVFFESVELYKLSLTLNGDSISGGYVAYPSSGSTWTGNAEGTRSSSA